MTTLADLDLEPGIRHWLSLLEETAPDVPGLDSTDLRTQREAGRRLSDLVAADCTLPSPEGIVVDDVTVDGPEGVVRLRRYRPSASPGPLPTQLWLHGGGFVGGSVDELINDRLCARRASDVGMQVLSLDYRLAPEHPYPAPVLDALAAVDALAAAPAEFGVDLSRLGIGGASAGAAIAASTALRLRGPDTPQLVHLALDVPVVAMEPMGASAEKYATGFGLDGLDRLIGMYVGPHGPADEYIAPLDVADLSGLPRTLVMVAEHDPLRDAGVRFAARLSEASVPVNVVVGAGHVHGSAAQTAVSAAARDWGRTSARHLLRAYS
ncbi:MAG: alpha/beta hydrolase fold domain-containing protein [Microbacterium enclense]